MDNRKPVLRKYSVACEVRVNLTYSDENVLGLIRGSTIKACALNPLPANIMRKCYSSLVPIFRRVINLSLSSGLLPKELKVALLSPLLKKLNADSEQFSNLPPVSNLKFLSKLIEKTAFVRSNRYLGENDLHEPLQSAYKIFSQHRDCTSHCYK